MHWGTGHRVQMHWATKGFLKQRIFVLTYFCTHLDGPDLIVVICMYNHIARFCLHRSAKKLWRENALQF